MGKTDTTTQADSQGAAVHNSTAAPFLLPTAFDHRAWTKYRDAAAARAFAASGRWLVSTRISHRSDEPPGGAASPPVFLAAKQWPFRTQCTDQGKAAAARRKYQACKGGFEGLLAILPGGIQAIKTTKHDAKPPHGGGGKRGEVSGFSKASQRKLMGLLQHFRFDATGADSKRSTAARCLFATLTYSDQGAPLQTFRAVDSAGSVLILPGNTARASLDYDRLKPLDTPKIDAKKVKRDIDALGKRLRRFRGFQGLLWKMEMEPRKSGALLGALVPHFHLIVLFKQPQQVRVFRRWLALAWFEVVGSGDPKHRRAGTQALVCYDGRSGKLFSYLGKYMGKAWDGAGTHTGRAWGKQGDLELAAPVLIRTTAVKSWAQFLRIVRQWGKRSKYLAGVTLRRESFRIYGYGPSIARMLDGLDFEPDKQPHHLKPPQQLWQARAALLYTLNSAAQTQTQQPTDTDTEAGRRHMPRKSVNLP